MHMAGLIGNASANSTRANIGNPFVSSPPLTMLSAAEVDLTEDEVRLLTITARLICIVKAYVERSPLSEGDQKIWDNRLAKEMVRPPSRCQCVYN